MATIGSGPTGGVVAAARAATAAGLGDVVSVDMGGTSYDVCLIRDGRPELKSDWNWRHRYCIALPMVDIPSVGAGGGSIAWDDGGILHVGPESAQSQPGPVCYGRGGTEPTVTDADLVLGRLDPAGFSSGRMELDLPSAAKPHSPNSAGGSAWMPTKWPRRRSRLVDAHMTDAIRRVLSLAGADPRTLSLVAFGGMGGRARNHAGRALGMRRVLVPRAAAGFSALGLLTADHVVDNSRGFISPWQGVDLDHLRSLADELETLSLEELRVAGVPDEAIRLEWSLLLVYPGQTFDAVIPVDDPTDIPGAVETFHRRNAEARLIEARAQEPIVRGVRLVAIGKSPRRYRLLPETNQRRGRSGIAGSGSVRAGRMTPRYTIWKI